MMRYVGLDYVEIGDRIGNQIRLDKIGEKVNLKISQG